MFVPVACLKCGQPFQVPDADAGKEVNCPWCKNTTMALPVAGSNPPVAHAPGSPAQPEPLSLDDDPAPVTRKRRLRVPKLLLVGLLSVAAFGGTLILLMWATGRSIPLPGRGHVPEFAWIAFGPPDGSFTIALPGDPIAEPLEAHPTVPEIRGGERYVTRGWYSRTTAWAGWLDLDPEQAKKAADDRSGALVRGLLDSEMERQRAWLGGTVTRGDMVVRLDSLLGIEVHMTTPRGLAVLRLFIAPDGPRPRIYVMGVESKTATADSVAVRRLFESFRIAKP